MAINPSYQNSEKETTLKNRLLSSFSPRFQQSKKTVTKLAAFFAVQVSTLTALNSVNAQEQHNKLPQNPVFQITSVSQNTTEVVNNTQQQEEFVLASDNNTAPFEKGAVLLNSKNLAQ